MYFKKTKSDDVHLYWRWFNQTGIKENSFSKKKSITYENHKTWFYNKILDNKVYMYILVDKKKFIGQIRLQKINTNKLVVSYSIDTKFRNKGYGRKIIYKIIKKFRNDKSLFGYYYYAKVKYNNYKSVKIFQSLNFTKRKYKDFITFKYLVST